jgi:hypothetical protein
MSKEVTALQRLAGAMPVDERALQPIRTPVVGVAEPDRAVVVAAATVEGRLTSVRGDPAAWVQRVRGAEMPGSAVRVTLAGTGNALPHYLAALANVTGRTVLVGRAPVGAREVGGVIGRKGAIPVRPHRAVAIA